MRGLSFVSVTMISQVKKFLNPALGREAGYPIVKRPALQLEFPAISGETGFPVAFLENWGYYTPIPDNWYVFPPEEE
jgi:hypothetical protein